jgi:hypothetical protein
VSGTDAEAVSSAFALCIAERSDFFVMIFVVNNPAPPAAVRRSPVAGRNSNHRTAKTLVPN